jgi:hypothetical protein
MFVVKAFQGEMMHLGKQRGSTLCIALGMAQEEVDSPVILSPLVSCQTISYNAFELSTKFIIDVGYLGT